VNHSLDLLGTIAVATLFGYALAAIEPYPNAHGLQVLVISTLFFLLVLAVLRNSKAKRVWVHYGITTSACYAGPFLWFWFGAMSRGWWYPPQPPIVQQFFFVDGEASYDAMVANLFLVLWPVATTAFAVRYLARLSKGHAE
jgi:hypothetical protein